MDPVRAIVLMSGTQVPAWVKSVLDHLNSCADVSLVALGLGPPIRDQTSSSSWMFRTYHKVDKRFSNPKPDAFSPVDCNDHAARLTQFIIEPDSETWVNQVRDLAPDVLIWLHDCLPPDLMRFMAPGGVWYLETGRRDGPTPGFWDVVANQPTTLAQLVVDTVQERHRVVYRSVSATQAHSVSNTRNQLLWKSTTFFSRMFKQFRERGLEKLLAQAPEPLPHTQDAPGNMEGARLLANLAYARTRNKIHKMLHKDRWQLYIHRGQGFPTAMDGFEVLEPPAHHYWADPFPVYEDGIHYLFFEEMEEGKNKGYLMVMPLDGPDAMKPQKILQQSFHLSYPFIFRHEGRYYMIPETRQAKSIQLWEATQFPCEWKPYKVLMEDIEAVDPTLFFKDGLWWLFASVASTEGASTCDELFLYYSADVFAGSWEPHPANPVVSDVRCARPAGRIFERDGKIYRPAQDCSEHFDKGGQGVFFQEITRLNTTQYAEKQVGALQATWDPHIKRLHTYNACKGLVVVDGLIQQRTWKKNK